MRKKSVNFFQPDEEQPLLKQIIAEEETNKKENETSSDKNNTENPSQISIVVQNPAITDSMKNMKRMTMPLDTFKKKSKPLVVKKKPTVVKQQEEDDYSKDWSYTEIYLKYNGRASIYALVRLTDTLGEVGIAYLLSRLDEEYLAANNLIIASNRLFLIPMTASFFSIIGLVHECNGDPEKIGTLIRKGFVSAFGLITLSTPLLLTSGLLLKVFGQDPNVCAIVEDYYLSACVSIPMTIFGSVVRQFALIDGRQNTVLVINVLNNVLSVGMGALFMLGVPGFFPSYGIKGLGAGISIASGITGIIYSCYLIFFSPFAKYKLLRRELKDLEGFWKIVWEGLPYSFQTASDCFLGYLGTIFIGNLGTNELTASRIVEMTYLPPYLGSILYPQVTALMAGKAKTANNQPLVNKIINANIVSMASISVLWVVAANLLFDFIVELFIDVNQIENQPIISMAKTLFWLYPIILLPEILRFTSAGALRGLLRDYRISMINSFAFLAVMGSLFVYLAYQFGSSIEWIYIARITSVAIGAAVLTFQCKTKISNYFQQNNNPQNTAVITHLDQPSQNSSSSAAPSSNVASSSSSTSNSSAAPSTSPALDTSSGILTQGNHDSLMPSSTSTSNYASNSNYDGNRFFPSADGLSKLVEDSTHTPECN